MKSEGCVKVKERKERAKGRERIYMRGLGQLLGRETRTMVEINRI